MKVTNTIILAGTLATGLVAAQDYSRFPDCAQNCLRTAFEASSCAPNDTICQCNDANIVPTLTSCVVNVCDQADLILLGTAAEDVCLEAFQSAGESAVASVTSAINSSVISAISSIISEASEQASSITGAVTTVTTSKTSGYPSTTRTNGPTRTSDPEEEPEQTDDAPNGAGKAVVAGGLGFLMALAVGMLAGL